jgi:hypothetical protein
LHYIFTGRSAPGSLAIGPTSPDEIIRSPKEYSIEWTFDDKRRLPENLKRFLIEVVSGTYSDVGKLIQNLSYLLQEFTQERG